MRAARAPYYHPILVQTLLPVFCTGTRIFPHRRVSRCLDYKGTLWDLSQLPTRKRISPFEEDRIIKGFLRTEGSIRRNVLNALAKCTSSSEGKPGCASILHYVRHVRLGSGAHVYLFRCLNRHCCQQGALRYFDATGREVIRHRKFVVCPICKVQLLLHTRVSQAGGLRYDPPLWLLSCPNPNTIDHRTPEHPRVGTTFYYDPDRNTFIKPRRSRARRFSRPYVQSKVVEDSSVGELSSTQLGLGRQGSFV